MHTAAWRSFWAGEGSKQKDSFVCHQLIMRRQRKTHPPARKCLSFNMMTESRLMRLSLKALQSNMSDCQDWCKMQFSFKCYDWSVINQNLCYILITYWSISELKRSDDVEKNDAHLSALGVWFLRNFRGLTAMNFWNTEWRVFIYFSAMSNDAQIQV